MHDLIHEQDKIKKIMIALLQLLLVSGRFKVYEHIFPEVGHTYMDSDRDFGLIGTQVRKTEEGILCQ